jgi:hypothetical protein
MLVKIVALLEDFEDSFAVWHAGIIDKLLISQKAEQLTAMRHYRAELLTE